MDVLNKLLWSILVFVFISCGTKHLAFDLNETKVFHSKDYNTQIVLHSDRTFEAKRIMSGGQGRCKGDWRPLGEKNIIINCSSLHAESGVEELLPSFNVNGDTIYIHSKNKIVLNNIIFKYTNQDLGW